jgi:hypothetical protein
MYERCFIVQYYALPTEKEVYVGGSFLGIFVVKTRIIL